MLVAPRLFIQRTPAVVVAGREWRIAVVIGRTQMSHDFPLGSRVMDSLEFFLDRAAYAAGSAGRMSVAMRRDLHMSHELTLVVERRWNGSSRHVVWNKSERRHDTAKQWGGCLFSPSIPAEQGGSRAAGAATSYRSRQERSAVKQPYLLLASASDDAARDAELRVTGRPSPPPPVPSPSPSPWSRSARARPRAAQRSASAPSRARPCRGPPRTGCAR